MEQSRLDQPTISQELFSLTGTTALVTGGAKGIGLFVVEGFVRAGVKVYVSSRDHSTCEAVAHRLSTAGSCVALPADLSSLEEIQRLANELATRESKLDFLINNSGASIRRPIESFSESDWDTVMNLNVKSVFFLSQSLLPLLRAAASAERPARIVNVGSIAGSKIFNNDGYAYMASKAALHHLTRALAARLVKEHINVNAIAPGPMMGGMMQPSLENGESRRRILGNIPMGRLGDAADMLGLVTFLCTRASAYLTGTVIPLDGGASTCV
jgi:NAD(P)-dependent dehydrogenase (short-subunit alcohol dehydrogenase family)